MDRACPTAGPSPSSDRSRDATAGADRRTSPATGASAWMVGGYEAFVYTTYVEIRVNRSAYAGPHWRHRIGWTVLDRAALVQQKTKRPVQFELLDSARKTMRA